VSLAEKVYQKSPVFLQNALLSAYGLHLYRLRFRGNFERRLGELLQSERFSAAQLLELQRRRLAELTRLLHERVPHYRDHLKSRGATPEDITLENFSAVFTPVTKAEPSVTMVPDAQQTAGRSTAIGAPTPWRRTRPMFTASRR